MAAPLKAHLWDRQNDHSGGKITQRTCQKTGTKRRRKKGSYIQLTLSSLLSCKRAQGKSHAAFEMLTHRMAGKGSPMYDEGKGCCLNQRIWNTGTKLHWVQSRQHWGRYHYLKQAFGALQWAQKGFHGYNWFRMQLWQGEEFSPCCCTQSTGMAFSSPGDPQAFTPPCKCTLFLHTKHEFKYLCIGCLCQCPHCELLRAEVLKKRIYNIFRIYSFIWFCLPISFTFYLKS